MMRSNSKPMPLGLSITIALAAVVFGMAAWVPLVNSAPNAIEHRAVFAGLLLQLLALLPLALLASWRPLAPMRTALAIVVVLSVLGMMSLPAPPRPESIGSFVLFFIIVVLAVSAHLLAAPRPRLAFAALTALAGLGLYLAYGVDLYATSPRFGAAVKISSRPLVIVSMACLAACWHGRGLFRLSRVRKQLAAV